VIRDAVIDPTGIYRYSLTRTWSGVKSACVFVMLNPSKADATIDDPTIRRCCSFAEAHGYGGIEVVNLYAYRATSPKELRAEGWPIGPENDDFLLDAFRRAMLRGSSIVCAWGAEAARTPRAGQVLHMIRGVGPQPYCLGTTAEGYPRHPLYVRGDAKFRPFAS